MFCFHCIVHTGVTGWQVQNRGSLNSNSWIMVSPDQKFVCDGLVTEWRYQGKRASAFQAMVWRQIEGSATQFQIVGINDIPGGAVNTPVTYTVPEDERIIVRAGDVIGWSFGEAVLPYNEGGDYRVRWLQKTDQLGNLTVNQVHDIIKGVTNREYSIAATVGELGKQIHILNYTQFWMLYFLRFMNVDSTACNSRW